MAGRISLSLVPMSWTTFSRPSPPRPTLSPIPSSAISATASSRTSAPAPETPSRSPVHIAARPLATSSTPAASTPSSPVSTSPSSSFAISALRASIGFSCASSARAVTAWALARRSALPLPTATPSGTKRRQPWAMPVPATPAFTSALARIPSSKKYRLRGPAALFSGSPTFLQTRSSRSKSRNPSFRISPVRSRVHRVCNLHCTLGRRLFRLLLTREFCTRSCRVLRSAHVRIGRCEREVNSPLLRERLARNLQLRYGTLIRAGIQQQQPQQVVSQRQIRLQFHCLLGKLEPRCRIHLVLSDRDVQPR